MSTCSERARGRVEAARPRAVAPEDDRRTSKWGLLAAAGLLLCAPRPAAAGSFEIAPIPLVLEPGTKITAINVKNTGEEKVAVQGEAVGWTQDEIGTDQFAPAQEIVFYPRIFVLEKGEETTVRIGYRGEPAAGRERAYRLILRELPPPKSGKSIIHMALHLSVPLFVKPPSVVSESALEDVQLTQGAVRVKVRNKGSVHLFVKNITATGLDSAGKEVFTSAFRGWYVLAGKASTFLTEVEEDRCRDSRTVKVVVTTKTSTAESVSALNAPDCAHPPATAR